MKANDEMIQGYLDGFDLTSPEPSGNRSRSYCHGFLNGRDDRSGKPRASYEWLVAAAEEAMKADANL